jgi:large subunit ribosomal protein L35
MPFFEEGGQSQMQKKAKSIKTRKSVAKRFKITGTGKIVRNRPGKRHLLASKSPKRRRRLGTPTLVDKTDYARVMENLPFSH